MTDARPEKALAGQILALRAIPAEQRSLSVAVAIHVKWLRLEPDLASTTKSAYSNDVLAFADTMQAQGKDHLLEIETEDLELWRHSMGDLSPSTISRKLSAVSEFFKWARIWKLVSHNPVEAVRRPRKRRKEPAFVSLPHFERLLAACQNAKERAVLGCLFWGGLRRHEVASLRIGSVDLESRRIQVGGKGGHVRQVPLCRNLGLLLEDHLKGMDTADADAPLFSNREHHPLSPKCVNRWFKRWRREAGLESHGYTPHSGRHGAGSLLGANGFGAFEISQYLGHQDPRTTYGYVHTSPELLRQKLDELPVFGPEGDERSSADLAELKSEVGGMRSELGKLVSLLGASNERPLALLQGLGETCQTEGHPNR